MVYRQSGLAARRGAVAPLTALLMTFILAMVAFALDIGYIALVRTQAQGVADSAALAGMNKLAEKLKAAPIVAGVPQQTSAHLQAARDEVKVFARLNAVGGQTIELLDSDIEIGYLADPYDQTKNTLDSTGWPARPYNAVRVKVTRDKDHAGGSVKLFFAAIIGTSSTDISASATACFVMGNAKPKGNNPNASGGILPITYQVNDWDAAMALSGTGTVVSTTGATILVTDDYKVAGNSSSSGGVSDGTDSTYELKLYPNATTSGNFGTINFTLDKSSNSTDTLRDLIKYGPDADDWPDLPTILNASATNPVSVNGDPGISAGMESAVKAVIGQPRVLPLYSTVTQNGNNTFYTVVRYVPVTIVDVDLGAGNKKLIVQPRVLVENSSVDGSLRIDFDIVPSANPNPLFIGARALVR